MKRVLSPPSQVKNEMRLKSHHLILCLFSGLEPKNTEIRVEFKVLSVFSESKGESRTHLDSHGCPGRHEKVWLDSRCVREHGQSPGSYWGVEVTQRHSLPLSASLLGINVHALPRPLEDSPYLQENQFFAIVQKRRMCIFCVGSMLLYTYLVRGM